MAAMKPGMSPWFTVISLAAGSFETTSPCIGYFLVRLQSTNAAQQQHPLPQGIKRDFIMLSSFPVVPRWP